MRRWVFRDRVFAVFIPAFLAASCLTWRLGAGLSGPPAPERFGDILVEYGQGSGGDSNAYQRILRRPQAYAVTYGFRNFNQDELSVEVQMPKRDVDEATREYGYSDEDLKGVDDWYQKAQQAAIGRSKLLYTTGKVTGRDAADLERKLAEANRRNRSIQVALDQTLNDLAQEYRQRRLKVYQKAGFRYKDQHTVEVDVPAVVRQNARRMGPASVAFSGIVNEKGYGMEELVGAVTSMTQTAMRYEVPGDHEGDKTLGGLLPPPKSFVLGFGDCDTKTALIGSILANWPNLKVVGLAIPEHYLLAVERIPARGDVYVDYGGNSYVMIEAAGPAWLAPGTVGEHTQEYLSSGQQFAIQPFF